MQERREELAEKKAEKEGVDALVEEVEMNVDLRG
jgi:hypothetical protein